MKTLYFSAKKYYYYYCTVPISQHASVSRCIFFLLSTREAGSRTHTHKPERRRCCMWRLDHFSSYFVFYVPGTRTPGARYAWIGGRSSNFRREEQCLGHKLTKPQQHIVVSDAYVCIRYKCDEYSKCTRASISLYDTKYVFMRTSIQCTKSFSSCFLQ